METLVSHKPSPRPARARPTRSMGRSFALAWSADPTQKTDAPASTMRRWPNLSASCPAKKAGAAPMRRRNETVNPRMFDESSPKTWANWGIVVIAPMEPVSYLRSWATCVSCEERVRYVAYPLRKPPIETMRVNVK